MYSIPQTLLSEQTLLSKRCYDPQFLVVSLQDSGRAPHSSFQIGANQRPHL
jgi:hypothetical protein